jgi:N-acetylmuramoyl-L-alanine amidase
LLLIAVPAWLVLCCFALVLVSGQSLAGKIVVIDAGHGGIDSGANRPGAIEKQINLAVALKVRDRLKEFGAKVILTRDTDVELSDLCDNEKVRGRYSRDLNARLEMVEESDADLFVSIHANASADPKRRGVECYYAGQAEAGKRLALAIQEQLRIVAPVSQAARPADYFVIRRNKVPAALIEVGFITHAQELALLQTPEYQTALAAAIASGIDCYCKATPSGLSILNQ